MTPAPPPARRLGAVRRMQRLSDADGFIRVAAIDHPENYLALFDADLAAVGFGEVVESKLELLAGMSSHCSAVLVDPVWSYGQGVLTGAIPGSVGIISGLERLAYSPAGFGTETELREHWTVPTLSRLGADAAKLVVFYRAERTEVAERQRAIVRDLVAQCRHAELPLVVEPLWFPLEHEDAAEPALRQARAGAIVEAARVFAGLGADVLKVEFPGDVGDAGSEAAAADRCAELDAGLDVPWVLLSSSATFQQFRRQLEIAAPAGASGFMAGRAIWGDAVGRFDEERRRAGVESACARLDELADVVRAHGRPWRTPPTVQDAIEALPADWHQTYG